MYSVTEAGPPVNCDNDSRFRALFDHAAIGIAVVRRGGHIAEVNQALLTMLGYDAVRIHGINFANLIHPNDFGPDAEQARRLLRGEIPVYSRDNRYRRADGSWMWGRVRVSLVPGPAENRFAVVMIEDIDDRRRAETHLNQFRAVMEASHEAIAILTPDGRIFYANSAFGRLFDLAVDEVVGRTYRSFFPPESQATITGSVLRTLECGQSWEGVLEARDGGGRAFPLWQRAGSVREADGAVTFHFAFMHDHTAQQLFQDELYDAKEAAEEAAIAKTRFLAAASHDLRQPMQALAMFVAVLAGHVTEPTHVQLVSRVNDSVTALEGLLNSLLDVSKLDAGMVVPHKEDIAVAAMMRRLAAEIEPLCEAKGLKLGVVPTTLIVRSDPSLLERVLRNLLANAVHYTLKGGILFGCRRRGKVLRFEVWDSGIGIPAAEIKSIFREFHQVGNQGRDRRQGLGLGLAIVDRLAALLDHRVVVASVEGKGSMFAVEASIVGKAAARAPRQLPLGLTATGARIVLIDDEPDVLESLRLLLESWGHHILPAVSAEEAIRQLAASGEPPDLIVADYRLQNGDTGGQAIARIEVHLRADHKLPAIILTGDTAPERLLQAQALGYRLLHKPVQAEALRAAIDAALVEAARLRRRTPRRPRKSSSRKAKEATDALALSG